MSEKDKKKRPAPVSYRPPEELREAFHERVKQSGLNTSAYITRAVFGQQPERRTRHPPIEEKLLAKLLVEAAQIRMLLAEIEKSGDPKNALDHDELVMLLQDIRNAILKSMGRRS